MMERVSSNLTIFFKIFIPTVWITFFGLMSIGILISEPAALPFGGGITFKLAFVSLYLLFLALMIFTIMRLKRVEFGPDGIYVTNYFKTYRYKYQDLVSIDENTGSLVSWANLELKEAGAFGKKIPFLISRTRFNDFLKENPQLFKHLISVQ